jgi:outer membrane biosynthesis protein TonB
MASRTLVLPAIVGAFAIGAAVLGVMDAGGEMLVARFLPKAMMVKPSDSDGRSAEREPRGAVEEGEVKQQSPMPPAQQQQQQLDKDRERQKQPEQQDQEKDKERQRQQDQEKDKERQRQQDQEKDKERQRQQDQEKDKERQRQQQQQQQKQQQPRKDDDALEGAKRYNPVAPGPDRKEKDMADFFEDENDDGDGDDDGDYDGDNMRNRPTIKRDAVQGPGSRIV